ncbi:MAG: protoporphyrinogen oxidase [Gemmatimonadota bacterium]|jgi:oxygen-dependent protoporphyrinogen oxidase|nr:protoporphyrinogen oxidase [Gemmatimonadota bacterium]MDP6530078.1 protoporphyrinogen oxidase [Gemmatimonadota bacterium]MDP6803625.1 protoporphyrinogen oxidase [Gemmatimonadota bacterium]MDP7032416.1 protoporphyrinogen oxidase [Gemmatimonadota bacterium]
MRERNPSVAVIGGGVSGLATAFHLVREAAARDMAWDVRVFEREGTAGGKLRTRRARGFLLEEGPNGFLDNEPATLRLVEQLSLEDELLRSRDAARRRFLLRAGRLVEIPLSPVGFVRSPLLPPWAKARVACEALVPPRRDLGKAAADPSTDETVHDFGQRRLGREFAEVLLDPMVKGVFGGDSRRLSLASAFPKMVEMEREHGGLFRALIRRSAAGGNGRSRGGAAGPGGTLHGFRSGMAALPDALAASLGDRVRCGASVTKVERRDGAWFVHTPAEEHGPFDAVLDASPAHSARDHLPGRALPGLLAQIPYAPMAVVTLAWEKSRMASPPDGFGMLIPTREKRDLLGVLWSASIFDGRAPDGQVLLRCMAGGAAHPEIMEREDDELIDTCVRELRGLHGLAGNPSGAWVVRHERAIAQYEPGHLARLEAMDAALAEWPGLFLAGSSYRGIAVNHCVAEAERTAVAIADALACATQEV